MKIIILAGGTGTRLWPVSRKKSPKQIKIFFKGESLLKATVKRTLAGFDKKDIFLAINSAQQKFIEQDLKNLVPQKNYLVEPAARDTAAAIGLACSLIAKVNPNEIIAVVNSDHYIKNIKEYLRLLKAAGQVAKKYPDHLVLLGLKPTYPETGYGYIKLNKKFITRFGKDLIYKADGFKEKPDYKTAIKYLNSKSYLWNPAYFVFRADLMLGLYKKFLPKHYEILMKIQNNPASLKKEFLKLEKISIDYGIMEKAKKMLCLPGSFDWTDIGHFRSLYEILPKDKNKNVVEANYLSVDSSDNFIFGSKDKLIATVGIKNTVIVDTGDALLVCPLDKAQEVKKVVERLKQANKEQYL